MLAALLATELFEADQAMVPFTGAATLSVVLTPGHWVVLVCTMWARGIRTVVLPVAVQVPVLAPVTVTEYTPGVLTMMVCVVWPPGLQA